MKYLLLFASAFMAFSCLAEQEVDCSNPVTSLDFNYCMGLEAEQANQQLEHYWQKSLERNSFDPTLVEEMKVAHEKWDAYRQSHCDSIYTMWREGTIRNAKWLNCRIQLTKQRTHILWENFLTYADSTPPVLPEPK
ncbi:lysozyme inhibitor LprI family protein [Vibrio intestinalis]|uniref:lysozyme inhibitor LprI family protein n=1 Tax=Vibrio intestinalis TaxID=2933291 RepID=UPI0021A83B41|nr:lysozyme inhibitor LprI family protein [Vibrio intestinalis]